MRFSSLCAGLVMLCFCHSTLAFCFNEPTNNIEDRAEFLHAVVRSLDFFESAHASLTRLRHAKDAEDILGTVDISNEQLQCAADAVGPYKNSKSEAVLLTATGLGRVANSLISLNTQSKDDIVAELNGDNNGEKAGDRAERMATLGTNYRNVWSTLSMAATTASLALIEFEPGTNQRRLAITTSQRNVINRELQRTFPRIAFDKHAVLPPAENAAEILYETLNDRKFPMHEQPFTAHVKY
jgi:hypothetical protein